MKFLFFNLLLGAFNFILSKIQSEKSQKDPFESLNELEDAFREIEETGLKPVANFMRNLLEGIMDGRISKQMFYLFIFILYSLPIFNIIFFILHIKNLLVKDEKE